MSIKVSSTISVSSPTYLDCNKLAEFLGNSGIITSVSSNISILPKTIEFRGKKYTSTVKEKGCRLTQSVSEKDEIQIIWDKLKNEYGFKCAHLNLGNQFDGCILDYLAPSRCSER